MLCFCAAQLFNTHLIFTLYTKVKINLEINLEINLAKSVGMDCAHCQLPSRR